MSVLRYIGRAAWQEASMLARTIYGVFVMVPAALPLVATRLDWPWLSSVAALLPWWGWLWTAAIIATAGLLITIAKRTYRLEKAAEPKLGIILEKNTIHIVSGGMTIVVGTRYEQRIEGTLIRVTVLNKSTNKSVKDVRCVIPKIAGYDHAFSNQKLQPLAASPSFQLSPGGRQVVGVLFVPNDVELGEIFILYDNRLEIGRGLPRKDHRLLVQAQGLDIAPASRWLVIKLDGEIDAYLEDKNGAW